MLLTSARACPDRSNKVAAVLGFVWELSEIPNGRQAQRYWKHVKLFEGNEEPMNE
jgi:hypothetical protein